MAQLLGNKCKSPGQTGRFFIIGQFLSVMTYTDPNCPTGAQGITQDTSSLQRNAEDQQLIEVVDTFLQDHGISTTADHLTTMMLSMYPPHSLDKDCQPVEWSSDFLRECQFSIGELITFLCKLYEIRASHLYTRPL